MFNWIDEQVAKERRRDMLREADREQLAASASARYTPHTRLYDPALAWFGGWLIAWGSRLQQRYGAIREPHVVSETGNRIS
jgi:hypothetical protein